MDSKNLLSAVGWFGLLLFNTILAALFGASFRPLTEFFGGVLGLQPQIPENPVFDILLGAIAFLSLLIVEAALYMRSHTERLDQVVGESVGAGLKSEFESALFEVILPTSNTDRQAESEVHDALNSLATGFQDTPPLLKPVASRILKKRAKHISTQVKQLNQKSTSFTPQESVEINNLLTERHGEYTIITRELVDPHVHWTAAWKDFIEQKIRKSRSNSANFYFYNSRKHAAKNSEMFKEVTEYLDRRGFSSCYFLDSEKVSDIHSKSELSFEFAELFGNKVAILFDKKGSPNEPGFVGGEESRVRLLDIPDNPKLEGFLDTLGTVREEVNDAFWSDLEGGYDSH